jgi:hypothetical protein
MEGWETVSQDSGKRSKQAWEVRNCEEITPCLDMYRCVTDSTLHRIHCDASIKNFSLVLVIIRDIVALLETTRPHLILESSLARLTGLDSQVMYIPATMLLDSVKIKTGASSLVPPPPIQVEDLLLFVSHTLGFLVASRQLSREYRRTDVFILCNS